MTDVINDADGSSSRGRLTQKQDDENWKLYCERQDIMRLEEEKDKGMINDALSFFAGKKQTKKGFSQINPIKGVTKRERKRDGSAPDDGHQEV